MMDIVIRAVEKMAKKQGIKSLKITTRDGVLFEDADWIEEIDGAENKNKNNESKSDSDSDSDDDSSLDSNTSNDVDELDDDMDKIDRQEINDLLVESRNANNEETNPAIRQEQPPNNDNEA
jgi:hypothetical protein